MLFRFLVPPPWRICAGNLEWKFFHDWALERLFAAVGPVTAAALRKAGLPVAIESRLATGESMAASIAKYFMARTASQSGSL